MAAHAQRMRKILQLAWSAHPLERLQSSLQRLDSTPSSAFDLVFADRQNPFFACRSKLAHMMRLGVGGPFACLFELLPVQLHEVMADEMSCQLSGFIAQVRWRFLEYETFPFQWNRVLHGAVHEDEIDDIFTIFFEKMHSCCRRRGMDDKMFCVFGGDEDPARSKALMRQYANFWNAFKSWMRSFRWTDMNMERLFAQFRHWLASDNAPVERMLGVSLLGQVLAVHDGADPRYVTRQQLLADDVPIAARKRTKIVSRPASAYVLWMKQQEATREGSLTKHAYREWQGAKSLEWKNEVSQEMKMLLQQEALQAHLNRKAQEISEGDADTVRPRAETFVKTFVDSVNTKQECKRSKQAAKMG